MYKFQKGLYIDIKHEPNLKKLQPVSDIFVLRTVLYNSIGF